MTRIWKFGDDVNTDEIIPARYNITIDPHKLAKHVFCEVRPTFTKEVQNNDIIIAGSNFGCGSSREHAPIAIKGSGIKCIIAKSYARIFYRNAINIGLPILECNDIDEVSEQDDLFVNTLNGEIKNNTTQKIYQAKPLPAFVHKIVEAGGIVPFLKNHEIEDLK